MLIMFKVEGDDILSEVILLNNSKKIWIYVKKVENKYVKSCKCFATHVLEQTLDNNNNVVEEVIKKNPHHVDWEPPEGHGVFFD